MKKILYIPYSPRNSNPSKDEGFSILEVIIALAILSIAFLPIIDLQRQMARTTIRLEEVKERTEIKANINSVLASINFSAQPENSVPLNNGTLTWSSQPLSEVKKVYKDKFQEGRFEVLLYDVAIEYKGKEAVVNTFKYVGLGWRPIRQIDPL